MDDKNPPTADSKSTETFQANYSSLKDFDKLNININNKNLNRQCSNTSNSSILLAWDRFNYWINAILVVTFDIEMGQSLESIYPSAMHSKLTQNDKLNICYMCFPDSNSGFLGDTQFHFRFKLDNTSTNNAMTPIQESVSIENRQNKTFTNLVGLSDIQNKNNSSKNNQNKEERIITYDDYNNKCLAGLEVDKSHLFGYVFFRQVKDKSLKRGYLQKSVVLLSKFPFISLFNYILGVISVEYFLNGAQVLETACNDIDKWPMPIPGQLLSLPILGNLIEISLPNKIDKYTLPVIYKKQLPSVPFTLAPVHQINLYKALQPILVHIHMLWELILLNEPIVVIANVPSTCSELVQVLVSLIWPLKYSSDYRPFFTIHNTEFAEYSSKSNIAPSLVIGVTNPFFTKCFQHWPNIIKISDNGSKSFNQLDDENNPSINVNGGADESGFNPILLLQSLSKSTESLSNLNTSSNNKSTKIKKTNNIRVVDSKPAVYSRYESFLSKDKTILKSLIRGAESNRPQEAQSAILRRYFIDLTQSFMIPLERYFSSLMPLHKSITPFKSVPKLKDFDADEFLKNLKQAGPELAPKLKGDWSGLYKRFFDSLNFKHWLGQKKKEADQRLQLLHLEILCDYDINKWLKGKQEIEIIDQYMNVRKKMDLIESCKIEVTDQIRDQVNSMLKLFLNALPEDSRSIFQKKTSLEC